MNQLTVVLVTALVTGVVSVSGIWLGSHLTRENEDRKWRRDHAQEAYSEVVKAVEAVRNAADISYFVEACETERHGKQIGVVADKLAELLRVVQSVMLVAPNAVNVPMLILRDYMGEVAEKSNNCPKIEKSERKAIMSKFSELLVRFLKEARNDLGIHPSPYRGHRKEMIVAG